MVVVIASFVVKAEHIVEFKAKCAELITASRQDKGCITYKLHQDNAQANHFVFFEQWETQANLDAHSASIHFTDIVPLLVGWLEQAPSIQTFTEI